MSEKVLVTGGAGFIGHILIKHLLDNTDWEIVTIDRLDYSGNLNRFSHMLKDADSETKKRVKIIYHDLKSEINNLIDSQIRDVKHVFHLAASSHVDRSIVDPMTFVYDNVVATGNLLNYARNLDKLETFVYFSTDEVFVPAPDNISFKEWDRYNSTNPYSASKAGGEELAVAFENTYDLPILITHTMNVFGERQHPEKFIPMCIKKIRDGETVTIHSDKTKKIPGSRHYIHAEDVAEAIHFILTNKIESDVDYGGAKCPKFNIVGSEELNNLELAHIIAKSQGKELKYEMVDFHSSRPGHDLRYSLSGEKMKKLGWTPSIKLTQRIKQVVDWSLKNDNWIEL